MTGKRADVRETHRLRKITVVVPDALHARLHVAKLWSGKPLYVLVNEALERVVADYRAARRTQRDNDDDA
ncbi:MAG: hypothetical protein AB7G40_05480 [Hyphomonadaceae bacterium]